jgi:hypothetical protein
VDQSGPAPRPVRPPIVRVFAPISSDFSLDRNAGLIPSSKTHPIRRSSSIGLVMKQPAAPPREDDQRLAPVLNVLWAAGTEVDGQAAARAFAALAGAARLAPSRWPKFYREPGRTRLLNAQRNPLAPAIREAASRAGLALAPLGEADRPASLVCEAAIVAGPDFGAIPETLPAVVAGQGGAPRLAAPDAAAPSLAGSELRRGDVEATPESLADALLAPPRGAIERRKLTEYFAEDVHASGMRFEYEFLLRLIGERSPETQGYDDAWDRAAAFNAGANVDRGAMLALLGAEYQRADTLALAYGRRWRSTLAARSFLLFGANLLSGLIGTLFPTLSVVTLPLQFAITALLYLDQHVSGRGRWRAKWIDYRRAAEATRIARFCILAGVPLIGSAPPSWIDWRLAGLLRSAEPAAPLADSDAAAFLAYLGEVEIDRQIAYQRGAFRRFRRLNARLRRAAVFTLLATIGLGGALAIVAAVGVSTMKIPLLGAIGLALSAGPGVYAALNGLRGQLDVERQAARSARIGLALRRLRRALVGAPPNAALARAAASRAAEIMHDDVSSWDRVMEIV